MLYSVVWAAPDMKAPFGAYLGGAGFGIWRADIFSGFGARVMPRKPGSPNEPYDNIRKWENSARGCRNRVKDEIYWRPNLGLQPGLISKILHLFVIFDFIETPCPPDDPKEDGSRVFALIPQKCSPRHEDGGSKLTYEDSGHLPPSEIQGLLLKKICFVLHLCTARNS